MNGIRLLIADNSPVYKKMFAQAAIELDKSAKVAYALNCSEALDSIKRHNYDVIVIDTEISGLDMALFLNNVMRQIPKALVFATAQPSSVSDKLCAEAMAKGAFNYMVKPIHNSYSANFDFVKGKMSDLFKVVHEVHEKKKKRTAIEPVKVNGKFQPEIVLIAVSTGGPMALENILSKLPEDFPVPILVVQHMPAPFIKMLAHHLNQKSRLKVKVAEDNERVVGGTVYIAVGEMHMKLDAKNRIQLDDSPPLNNIRPAADILFESVAESFTGSGVLAVILTGMGNDGERGLAALKQKQNCFCLAQSEETCVVYGMPCAAMEARLVDKILDLDKISSEVESFNYTPMQMQRKKVE
ncbi:MAG: response regulator [Spirochaetaceae bacterium]|nr:response regulator [Spirochaetaceae bacterium]